MNLLQRAIENKVVDEVYHSRLLANLPQFAETANIPESYVLTSMLNQQNGQSTCSQVEIDWVKGVRKNTAGDQGLGLLYVGEFYPPVMERMMLMTGAFLRNYLDARLIALKELVDKPEKFYSAPTILIVPNFSITRGKAINWDTQLILGLLMRRIAATKYTVLYAQSMETLKTDYGSAMVEFIENHFTVYNEGSE